jgi:hypothetical protein
MLSFWHFMIKTETHIPILKELFDDPVDTRTTLDKLIEEQIRSIKTEQCLEAPKIPQDLFKYPNAHEEKDSIDLPQVFLPIQQFTPYPYPQKRRYHKRNEAPQYFELFKVCRAPRVKIHAEKVFDVQRPPPTAKIQDNMDDTDPEVVEIHENNSASDVYDLILSSQSSQEIKDIEQFVKRIERENPDKVYGGEYRLYRRNLTDTLLYNKLFSRSKLRKYESNQFNARYRDDDGPSHPD